MANWVDYLEKTAKEELEKLNNEEPDDTIEDSTELAGKKAEENLNKEEMEKNENEDEEE